MERDNNKKVIKKVEDTITRVTYYFNNITNNKYNEMFNVKTDDALALLFNADYPYSIYADKTSKDCESKHGLERIQSKDIKEYELVDNIIHTLSYMNGNNDLNNNGLKNGMISFLTSKYLGHKESSYPLQMHIAEILAGGDNNQLLDAYLSKSPEAFKAFLEDFDKNQDIIDSQILMAMSNGDFEENEYQLLKGCLQYSLNKARENGTYNEERNRLVEITKGMPEKDHLASIALETIPQPNKCKRLSRH